MQWLSVSNCENEPRRSASTDFGGVRKLRSGPQKGGIGGKSHTGCYSLRRTAVVLFLLRIIAGNHGARSLAREDSLPCFA